MGKKGPHFLVCLGLGKPWVVLKESDFGGTQCDFSEKLQSFLKLLIFGHLEWF